MGIRSQRTQALQAMGYDVIEPRLESHGAKTKHPCGGLPPSKEQFAVIEACIVLIFMSFGSEMNTKSR